MKVVINQCYGGFGLSSQAEMKYAELKGIKLYDWKEGSIYFGERERTDPALIQVIKKLGKKANGPYADLKIVEIPDDVEWTIEEYDGIEWIAEKHRTWR